MYAPLTHWVGRGTGIPKEKDEVNKREVCEESTRLACTGFAPKKKRRKEKVRCDLLKRNKKEKIRSTLASMGACFPRDKTHLKVCVERRR